MVLEVKNTQWNLGLLYKGDDDPQMKKDRVTAEKNVSDFIARWKKDKEYLNNPAVLVEAMKKYEKLQMGSMAGGTDGAGSNEAYYFWLRSMINQNDSSIKARLNKSEDFVNKVTNDLRFFFHSISHIPTEKQKEFLKFGELKEYRHILERLFNEAKYLLSEEEEKLIALKAGPAHSNWTRMVSGFVSKEEREIVNEKGKKEKKNFSEIASLINSTNKKVRDSAAEAFNDIMAKNVDVAEAELNSIFANKKIDDEMRKMPRPDMARHVIDDIESEVVDTLVDSVSGRFAIAQRYYALKAKMFGLKKLEYHERNVPYGKLNKKYSYGEALNLVEGVLGRLDPKFSSVLKRFNEQGQIDVYPRKGKRSGGFCTDSLINQPTYIMLNHTDELNDVLTIAHELGHGINGELMKEKRNALDHGMVLSTAEVASTFMEDFVLRELEKEADDELKLALMMMKLNDEVSTIFRQVACYKFEKELHLAFREKGYLSKEHIGKIFFKNMKAYMGDAVDYGVGSENWWVYWQHIRSFFYVYSYASGLLISKAMQAEVKKDGGFINKVKEFLSSGMSDSPRNIFLKMGIDITKREFWNKGLDEIEGLLLETEKLAKKLNKI